MSVRKVFRMAINLEPDRQSRFSPARTILLGLAALLVVGALVWQAVTAGGNPDTDAKGLSPTAMVVTTGVLVFREGLEAILVLAAVTAGMARGGQRDYLRAVPVGGFAAFLASVATWFAVVAIIAHVNAPELDIQAATGLLAIVVLLVVMNWFFHKFYWTGWISHHSARRKRLMESAGSSTKSAFWGLALLGFTAIYREGFEVVLFLQNLRLQAGSAVVFQGMAIGLALTVMVAALTFALHQKLPFKKMLVATGVLLGVVLLVMVGESVQEMQQAGWLPTTGIRMAVPAWMGLWFSLFPNAQSLAAQALAGAIVLGSYALVPIVRAAQMRRKNAREKFLHLPRYASDETGHAVMPLSAMQPGEFGHVLAIRGSFQESLPERGFAAGTEIRVIQAVPLGGPMTVRLRGGECVLTRREAASLTMRRCPPEFDLGGAADPLGT